MNSLPKGPQAARLRQRKFELISRFNIPPDLLPGSVSLSHFRCGKPTCHCTQDEGHPAWSFTYRVNGATGRRWPRVPGRGARSPGCQRAAMGIGGKAETRR